MSKGIVLNFEDEPPLDERVSERSRMSQARWDKRLNKVFGKGHFADELYKMLKMTFGGDLMVAQATSLRFSQIRGMSWSDIQAFTMNDLYSAVEAVYWQCEFTFDEHTYDFRITTPFKDVRVRGSYKDWD
ncbi:hypothetical protein [Thalassotalea sp. Y01]|uniref:hypothetical protein n=1 Tax=Thalassotalea sp. Y01 TaxID=2729613 RepID=UPI00145C49F9|nr:hypothetical protein [Thalassotalea sp. Y01]NMP16136.1 hypothetical protein [Thalassotalea sp. Y01]